MSYFYQNVFHQRDVLRSYNYPEVSENLGLHCRTTWWKKTKKPKRTVMRVPSGMGVAKRKAKQGLTATKHNQTKGQWWYWKDCVFWGAVRTVCRDQSQFFNKKRAWIKPNTQTGKPSVNLKVYTSTGTPGNGDVWGTSSATSQVCSTKHSLSQVHPSSGWFCTQNQCRKGWWPKTTPPKAYQMQSSCPNSKLGRTLQEELFKFA